MCLVPGGEAEYFSLGEVAGGHKVEFLAVRLGEFLGVVRGECAEDEGSGGGLWGRAGRLGTHGLGHALGLGVIAAVEGVEGHLRGDDLRNFHGDGTVELHEYQRRPRRPASGQPARF